MTIGSAHDTSTTIVREVVIDAPVDIVWRTVTQPEQITRWFADRVELDPTPGAEGALIFESQACAEPLTAPIVVAEVDEPRLFAFRWGHAAGQRADRSNSLLVQFTLTPEGDERTRLQVTETGVQDMGWPAERQDAYVKDHRRGWDTHLGRLTVVLSGSAGAGH
jgi:uncharacterized protein YndB with AHSA1/START domain